MGGHVAILGLVTVETGKYPTGIETDAKKRVTK